MTDNLAVKNAAGVDTTLRTSESGGVHTPHHAPDFNNGSALEGGRTVAGAANTPATGVQAVGEPLWSASDLTAVRINNAAVSGDLAVVAAVSGQTTRVHALRLSAAGAAVVQIKDGATVLEVINLAANQFVHLPLRGRPYWKGTPNTALNLNISAAVQVDGRLEYITAT